MSQVLEEKEGLMSVSNRKYPDASIVGPSAHYFPKDTSSLDGLFHAIAQSTDGVSFNETTGVLNLHQSILFDFNSDDVKDGSLTILKHIASAVAGLPKFTLQICGHTDNIGSPTYNQALSERRAEAVANKLVLLGIPKERLETFGRGASTPIATNSSEAGRSQNRRVDFILVK